MRQRTPRCGTLFATPFPGAVTHLRRLALKPICKPPPWVNHISVLSKSCYGHSSRDKLSSIRMSVNLTDQETDRHLGVVIRPFLVRTLATLLCTVSGVASGAAAALLHPTSGNPRR